MEIRAGQTKGLTNEVVGWFKGPGVTRGEHVVQFSHQVTATFISVQMKQKGQLWVNGMKVNQIGVCPEIGVDYPGYNMKSYTNIESWQHCADLCRATPKCEGWTYATDNFK